MASSSGAISTPEAIRVLVSSLADESLVVRDASLSALKDVAPLDPLLVLECCSAVSRGGRRRFGNMAGVFTVMACAVRAIPRADVDVSLLQRISKIATHELITSKEEINSDWQKAASALLVSIGSHAPDLMMEEIFHHFSGRNSSLPTMVQILADFASAEALLFTPRLKDVLVRVLPVLGSIRDAQRPVFAYALKCWSQAVQHCSGDCASNPLLDSDVMSFLNSVFELLLRVWASSRDLKARLSTIESLGEMVSLVTRTQLRAALPRLIPTVLDLYKKGLDTYLATCSLQNILVSSLLLETGPPLLDFEELRLVLCTLLPVVYYNSYTNDSSDISLGLKSYNELQRCFLVIGSLYSEDLALFLLNKCHSKDEPSVVGALCVIRHLIPRLEIWHNKSISLIDVMKSLLDEQKAGTRKALAELIVVLASHCYLSGPYAELFIEYLVRYCALLDEDIKNFKWSKDDKQKGGGFQPFQYKKLEAMAMVASVEELRSICEKGLLLVAITVPEMEHVLWPFLLKLIIPMEYTGALATIFKCISELCRRRSLHSISLFTEVVFSNDIPKPEDIFARLLVLLHDPLSRGQLASHILTVLCYLGPLFPKDLSLFWQDEVPKMRAYISDLDDLKQDPAYQETWDDMIINFLAESLDVVHNSGWVVTLGNVFARQYTLYSGDHEHSALLHRCLGMLLQKVEDGKYVHDMVDCMYMHANISISINRLGLAKGIGLVAASHLDTVLDKLKYILDNVVQSRFQRFLLFFSGGTYVDDADDVFAALALMYGYAARYAPITVIEARINALVGTNVLSRLLHVQNPTSKQAVITAIELLGQAVINAAEMGVSFPLKRRDQLLDYVLTLMGRDETDGYVDSSIEYLQTQSLALRACTILVSIEPKLPMDTRSHVMKATLDFFALPNDPSDVVDPLIKNLTALLCAILQTSGEDGRSQAEHLIFILRLLDRYVSSPMEHQRRRGCISVYELLHSKYTNKLLQRNSTNLPSAFIFPTRESLCLGERVMSYIPRCADISPEIRKMAIEVVYLFFNISLSLPKSAASYSDIDLEVSYNALSSLEDVISMLRMDASIDQSEVFNRVVSSICVLLTKDELVLSLYSCTAAICDKIKASADGTIQAVSEFFIKRGIELNEGNVSRATQSLLSAILSVTDKQLRQEILSSISCLAESTNPKIVFSEVLTTGALDIVKKDVSRLRGGWPIQDAFCAFSQHATLSCLFLEHVISMLNQLSINTADPSIGDNISNLTGPSAEQDILQAAYCALNAVFRGGGKIGKKAVEKNYSSVLSALILQLGSCHGLACLGQDECLRALLTAFHSFCDCVGDLETGKILSRYGERKGNEKWINMIQEIACCTSIKRPKEVVPLCMSLTIALNRHQQFQREAAAAALSEFICCSDGVTPLLESIAEAMCLHVSDESSIVRSLCLQGLVQIPESHMHVYIAQILGVIIALLEDADELVQLTAVDCLLKILKSSPNDVMDPMILNLSLRLRNLQICMDCKIRCDAFAAYGALGKCGTSVQKHAFVEQVHATLSRLILHVHDEDLGVRQACRNTLKDLAPLINVNDLPALLNKQYFYSNHRSDYEVFVRDMARLLCHLFGARVDIYLASTIQAFDAPWPIIQANAIYFSACLLLFLGNQPLSTSYLSQVFGLLVSRMSCSSDALVRATSSFALGLLFKAAGSRAVDNYTTIPGGSS